MNAPCTNAQRISSNDHAMNALLKIACGLFNTWPAEQILPETLNRISQACEIQPAGIYSWNSVRRRLELRSFESPNGVFFRAVKSIIHSLASLPLTRIQPVSAQENFETLAIRHQSKLDFGMKYHDRIFGIFQRLEGRSRFPENGIGLSVKAIPDKTDREIWIEASPGKGTKSFASLPIPANNGGGIVRSCKKPLVDRDSGLL